MNVIDVDKVKRILYFYLRNKIYDFLVFCYMIVNECEVIIIFFLQKNNSKFNDNYKVL